MNEQAITDVRVLWKPPDPFWANQAACRQHPDVNFFPGRGEDSTAAKAICATCSVRDTCLEVALRNVEKFGVWGGTSEKERRVMRRELLGTASTVTVDRRRGLRPIVHGTVGGYEKERRLRLPHCDECRQAMRLRYHKRLERQRGDAA